MSGKRWKSHADRREYDRRRRPLLDEYFQRRIYKLQWTPSGRTVTFSDFCELRLEGTWNETARANWPQFPGVLFTEPEE